MYLLTARATTKNNTNLNTLSLNDALPISLFEVFKSVKEKENGEKASVTTKATAEELRTWFAGVLPNFDRDRVYPSDIKKLITWYNILVETNNDDFDIKKTKKKQLKKLKNKSRISL